ncbi:MAG: PEP-CTERM sorting domain-containing protein [Phycisphaerales bacterium]
MNRTIALAFAVALAAGAAPAAYLFEIDTDGLDDGVITYNPRFSFGGDTTIASQSATAALFGATGGDSIFGGDGTNLPDTYVYRYAPDAEADNLAVAAGTDLGEGNLATGLTGGGAGLYRVYAGFPFTTNVSGGLTTYSVTTAGDSFSVGIDQNGGGAGRGGAWLLLGEINYTGGDITVTQSSEINTFVSMRAYGVLFEAVPAPGTTALLGLGALVAVRRRR